MRKNEGINSLPAGCLRRASEEHAELRPIESRAAGEPPTPLSWAVEIMEAAKSGEKLPAISIEKAYLALRDTRHDVGAYDQLVPERVKNAPRSAVL